MSCLHSENVTSALLLPPPIYRRTTLLHSLILTLLPELRIHGVYLETQDQDKNKLCVSDVVYG